MTKNFKEFEAFIHAELAYADQSEDWHEKFWATAQPWTRWKPSFVRPDWDVREALRLAKIFFENSPRGEYREYLAERIGMALQTRPNDAHMGDIRW